MSTQEQVWRRYRKRPVIVEARGPLTQPETIETREGTMRADVCDFIIRGTAGELYPIKPAIFAAIYDLVAGEEEDA